MEIGRRTVSVIEAAEILGIGRTTAYRLTRTGELPTIRVAGRVLVLKSGLDRLLGERL